MNCGAAHCEERMWILEVRVEAERGWHGELVVFVQ
jgi:hypothetical protein